MSRIRLNQEYRNKIANRMRVHLEAEDTVEKQNYDKLREAGKLTASVFSEVEYSSKWHKILYNKGWIGSR